MSERERERRREGNSRRAYGAGMGGSEAAHQKMWRRPLMSLSSDGEDAELGISSKGLAFGGEGRQLGWVVSLA